MVNLIELTQGHLQELTPPFQRAGHAGWWVKYWVAGKRFQQSFMTPDMAWQHLREVQDIRLQEQEHVKRLLVGTTKGRGIDALAPDVETTPSVLKGPVLNAPPHSVAEHRGEMLFVEDTDPFDRYTYRLSRVIHSSRTAFQNVVIADTYNYGRALFLDGAIQSAADDEALYHEMLVQPVMLAHPAPRDVLIIGGGEGATLREVLVHRSVRSATMVDLDREVVALCREHLVSWHCGAFDDPRVRLCFEDGRQFVEQEAGRYDVIIIDVVDVLDAGPANALCTRQFYEWLRRRLRPGGLVAIQGMEFSFLDDALHPALARTVRTVFPEVHSYRVDVPSFLGTWGFLIASDGCRPSEWISEEIDRRIDSRLGRQWLEHVTGEYLKHCFSLCKETRWLLQEPGPILEDGVVFVPPVDGPNDTSSPSLVTFPIPQEA